MTNTVFEGKIIKNTGGLYTVREKCGMGSKEINCRARGVFRHNNVTPLVGDNVDVALSDGQSGAVICGIKERKNSLIRPPISNVDCIFVTVAASAPSPMLDMIDKLVSILEFKSIEPVIVIGKTELDRDMSGFIADIYRKVGFSVFRVSCVTGEGIADLHSYNESFIDNNTVAFAGASGVGKSTLINRLFDGLTLETGEVSRKTNRGRHTTRSVTLLPVLDGRGYIADTPGFSMLDFEKFDFFETDDLALTFREFTPFLGKCRYTKCTHTKEEGCAVLEAVGKGDIPKSRHESYVMLYEVLKNKHKWDKK